MSEAMKPVPTVSVCIPVYNGEQYLEETLRSVLGQTYPNVEVIVQDNASTDRTWTLLQSLAAQHPTLSIQRNSRNVGMAGNWNLAINRAQGDYVMLLSADDLIDPDFVQCCLERFVLGDVDAVTANHRYLRDGNLASRKVKVPGGVYHNFSGLVLLANPFSINFTIFSQALIDRMRVDGQLFARTFYTCDYDLWFRLALSEARIAYLSQCLGTYRVHGQNLSRQIRRMSRQTFLVIASHKEALRRRARGAYRFTLVRFIARYVRNLVLHRVKDKRMYRALLAELRRA